MSDRPRAGARPAGIIARRHHKDYRLPGPREAIVSVYSEERRATAAAPGRGAPRVRSMSSVRHGARACCARPRGSRAIGNPPHLSRGGRQPSTRGGYTPGSRTASRRFDRGGPAIARSGRVVRPVRRPSDRQTHRRNASGDPREICNQVPSQTARDLSIPGADRALRVSPRGSSDGRGSRRMRPRAIPSSDVALGGTFGAGTRFGRPFAPHASSFGSWRETDLGRGATPSAA
jgi:hypothetical protein